MDASQIINKLIEYSKLNASDFAVKIGTKTTQAIYDLQKGRTKTISRAMTNKILSCYPEINKTWLITGEGEMLNQKKEAQLRVIDVVVRIPLVSQYAYAGYLTGFGDPEYIDTLPKIDFTPDRHMTGNYVAFEVKGDSMNDGSADSYLEGELLICREVEPIYWKDSKLFINKRDFVIIHKEGILIKRIITHDVENHKITIHSLNPLYPDEVLDLADVKQIFSVVESRRQRRR